MLSLPPTLAALSAFGLSLARSSHSVMYFFFHLGLIGLFLVSIVDSSFVPLPIPGVTDIMLILYAAGHTNPILLVALATFGSALGGLLSHAAGQAGGMKFLEHHVPARILSGVTKWMEHHPLLAVSLPALLPPPMPLSAFVLAAGAADMSRKTFMWSFTLSRLLRHAIAVWLGIHYGSAVLHLWASFNAKWATTLMIALWSIILIFTGFAAWKLYKTTRHLRPSKSQQPTTT